VKLRIAELEISQQIFGFIRVQEAEALVVGFHHLPFASLGGERIVAVPQASGGSSVNSGAHETEDIVHGLASQKFTGLPSGAFPHILFGFGIRGGSFQQFRLENGKQIGCYAGDGHGVYFVPQMGGVLAVMLVNVFAFAFAPGMIGVHGFPDGNLFALNGVDACGGKCVKELGSGVSGGLRADAFTVPADGFPVPFALKIGVPETVHAVSFAGTRIALCGQAVKDAFKLGFDVFSAGCVTHGSTIPANFKEGKMLIQNLSKMENPDKKMRYNYASIFRLSNVASEIWDGERAITVPNSLFYPKIP
jgi:hypothetical protein